ncbi:MAG: VCBS repeat-containing protein [Chitinophagaceae bacterium]|nr:VCBS repeat-containing protein [Chitinophagaceae bacterium]
MEDLQFKKSGGFTGSPNNNNGNYSSQQGKDNTADFLIQPPQINLPTGGGAIKSIDEKFLVNAVNGTASFSVPLPLSSARGFTPSIALNYNSGSGNGLFGLGWALNLSIIQRKTENEIPQYLDGVETDTFLFSGGEDLVPEYKKDAAGELLTDPDGKFVVNEFPFTHLGVSYTVKRYRPRIEGLFSRIERWTVLGSGTTHWRVISKDNITTIYGKNTASRTTDPRDEKKIFEWLPEFVYDDKGNCSLYEYKKEDGAGIDAKKLHNKNRINGNALFTNSYLKRIRYGNVAPFKDHDDPLPVQWLFETVFDYGEHDTAAPPFVENSNWEFRPDAFSLYRAGFEIRTCRLCKRVLTYHHFVELPGSHALVKSMDFSYDNNGENGFTFLKEISVTGFTKHDDGSYTQKSLPPFSFSYQKHEWNQESRSVSTENLFNAPSGIDNQRYQFVDLYSEGLPGILTEQGTGWFYKTNLGQGNFTPAKLVSPKPSFSGLRSTLQLIELEADGIKQIAHWQPEPKGFFELNREKEWQGFKPFEKVPSFDFDDPNLRLIDLNGDGKADVLIAGDEVFTWYRSDGKKGFDASKSVLKNLDDEKGPSLVFSDNSQGIFLADMSGDGLTDLVRIKNGDTCYWPNMGYGNFGAKISMDHSPLLDHPDQFNTAFIHLADIDGSGTTDLIYLGKNKCSIWLNQHGNSFLVAPKIIDGFPEISAYTQISIMDILGNGVACIVWNSDLPKHQNQPLRYIDLLNSKKPHILTGYKNNLGKEVELEYKASTTYYSEDKIKGEPWVSKLHFPVHCVSKTVTHDRIMKTRFASEYSYHHGYYDFHEKEFRGFGRVEQKDAEQINHFIKTGAGNNVIEQDLHQQPVLTKSWFHTGAFLDREKMISQFSKEYFQNTVTPENLLPEPELPNDLSIDELRETLRACKGMLLRKEVYALDGSPLEKIPYLVEQHNCGIKKIQQKEANKYGIYFVHESEGITYQYERNAADPRITHNFILDVDPFGNILQSVNIAYPRRPPLPGDPLNKPEQESIHILYTDNEYTKDVPKPLHHRSPLLHSSKLYEIKGLASPATYFDFNQVKTACLNAVFIDYEKPFTGGIQKRLIEFLRHQYRGDNGIAVLPLGMSEPKGLLHQSYKAAFNQGTLTAIFSSKMTLAALQNVLTDPLKGGYLFTDNYFWQSSGTRNYDVDHFYVSTQITNPFGKTTKVEYDASYFLFAEKITDPLNNELLVKEFNYRTLTPYHVKDTNDNETAVRFDELGMVVTSFFIGKKGLDSGDEFDNTKVETKAADDFPSSILEYHLFEWRNQSASPGFDLNNYKPRPNFFKKSSRETHYHADALHQTAWQESYSYSDGSGHEVLKKLQAEPGAALQVNADGTVTQIPDTAPLLRWTGNGRTILNNKGNIVKQYEPYFSTTPEFDDEREMVELGVTPVILYDPLGRIILTRAPNKTYSKVEFTPWQQTDYDFNDTVKDSGWYVKFGSPDPLQPEPATADARAAWLAAKHDNTPKIAHLDTLGRIFLTTTDKGNGFLNAGEIAGDNKLTTTVRLDIEGNELEIKDALNRPVVQYSYDITGNRIKQVSIDAGSRWMVKDVTGNPLITWDDRNHEFNFEYDELRRLTRSLMKDGLANAITVSRVEYGEAIINNKTNNLKGAIYKQYDQSGIVSNNKFDFKGNLLEGTRQLTREYKNTVDWTTVPAVALETAIFTSSTEYDALNRPVKSITPHSPTMLPHEIFPGYNEAGLLARVDVKLAGNAAVTPFITTIRYDAKGQREEIFYNNGTKTTYTYDKETFRLINLKTTRNPGPTVLQDLKYTYDPMGNITTIRDDAHPDIFFDGEQARAVNNYLYDAVYRLVSATGRKHAGQTDIQNKGTLANNNSFRNHPFVNNIVIDANDANAFRNYTETYIYDKAGNIKEQKHVSKNSGFTRLFEYDNNNNLNNRLTKTSISGDDYDYTYDAHGNMHGLETVQNEVWNFTDHFKQAVLGGGGTAYYVYDASGQRTRKVIERQNGVIMERIYLAGIEIFRETNGAGNIVLERETLHVMDGQQRVAMVDTPVIKPAGNTESQLTRYQYNNHLGSASLELDELAQIISYEEYFPYGTASFATIDANREVAARRYRYTGKERDEETGLNYHGARYYVMWLCRWTAADPAGIRDGLNVFAYAKQNPVKYFDPDGKANTPVHDYLTRIIALQYVDKEKAIAIGRAANRPDTEDKYGSEINSIKGDYDRVNQDIHALGEGDRETKVKAILESFNKRNIDNKSDSDKIEEAGIYMLHPIQDASYHLPGVSEGAGLGHLLFPEADLAVGEKSFEEFHQVIKDTEKGLELMKEKGILGDSVAARKKMTEAEWKEVYTGLKDIENKYKDDFLKLNVLGIGGTIFGKIGGLLGGMIGGVLGGLTGFVVALFSGNNVVEGAKQGFRIGTNLGQLILGAPAVPLGFFTIVAKNSLRNQVAAEQSNYLQEKFKISDSKDEITKIEPAGNLNYDLVLK